MKILYAIQGTGNGHVSRARDFIPLLQQRAELDILISGTQFDVNLPQAVKYKLRGASFIFGTEGGVDYWDSFKKLRPFTFFNDIRKLNLNQYDLVLNDFEPVSAWAGKIKNKSILALSHQSAFLSKNTPRPAFKNNFAEGLFKNYAPSDKQIAFHFKPYDEFITTPIIRKDIRALNPINKGHYTVYLPAYDDKTLIKFLSQFNNTNWQVFSKREKVGYTIGNVEIKPIHNENYNISVANCEGLLTGGGFEAPAEALFLGKKIMVVPMAGQYEQACNAEALRLMGNPVIDSISDKNMPIIREWLNSNEINLVDFPDNINTVVDSIFNNIENR
jgi:uncharacterized protein (TIGR00661 family)